MANNPDHAVHTDKHHDYSIGLLHCHGSIIMLRKAKPEWQKGKLNLPGGELLPDENFRECIIREFKQETGIDFLDWKLRIELRGRGYALNIYYGEWPFDKPRPEIRGLQVEPAYWFRAPEFDHGFEFCPDPIIDYDRCVGNMRWIIPFCLDKFNKSWIHVET